MPLFFYRIIWDKSLDENYFTVAYEDRFTGTIEKHFSEFNWDIPIASAGPDIFCIPQHRIQYFKFKNRVVWDKECRLDDFFGSTGSGTAIHDVMVQEEKEFVIPETNEVDESTFSKTLFEVGEYQFEEGMYTSKCLKHLCVSECLAELDRCIGTPIYIGRYDNVAYVSYRQNSADIYRQYLLIKVLCCCSAWSVGNPSWYFVCDPD